MNPGDNLEFDSGSNTLRVKNTEGVRYTAAGKVLGVGEHKFTKNTIVRARPRGRLFDEDVKTEWRYEVNDSDSPVEATVEPETEVNEVEDTPDAPTAGNTPESPEQQVSGFNVPKPGPRPQRP